MRERHRLILGPSLCDGLKAAYENSGRPRELEDVCGSELDLQLPASMSWAEMMGGVW